MWRVAGSEMGETIKAFTRSSREPLVNSFPLIELSPTPNHVVSVLRPTLTSPRSHLFAQSTIPVYIHPVLGIQRTSHTHTVLRHSWRFA